MVVIIFHTLKCKQDEEHASADQIHELLTTIKDVKLYKLAVFEIPTVVTMKRTTFWGVTPCSLVEVH
jgi:hypothetical protein